MSEKNREGKRTARERLREQQAQEKAAHRRRRQLKMAGITAAVLAVVGATGVVVANSGGDEGGAGTAAPIVQGKGRAPATLTVYEDFRCPACGQFEKAFRDTIHDLEDAGKLRTEYHIVTIIDDNMGGEGSANAANAAACARDEGRFARYHDLLFDEQPPEQQDAFGSTDRLIELAEKVEGLDGPTFRSCVRKGKHRSWVERANSAFLSSGHNATPTVLLDGKNIYGDPGEQLTPAKLRNMVEKAA